MFYGSKVNILSKYRLYPNIELTHRHSNKRRITYENDQSNKTESFWAPSADYIVTGIGLNYRFKPKNNTDFLTLNLSGTYSYTIGNYKIKKIEGPFSPSGESSAQSTVSGGYGFTFSGFLDFNIFFNKKKRLENKKNTSKN